MSMASFALVPVAMAYSSDIMLCPFALTAHSAG